MAKVSIICAAYNAALFIGEMIDSVMLQSFKDWELIIVNDGSTDSTYEICEQKSRTDQRVRVFSQKNQGAAVARNVGFDKSVGDFLMVLDADDRILRPALEDLISGFAGKEKVAVVYGDTWLCDESGNRLELFSRKYPDNYKSGQVLGALLSGNMFTVHSALIRRLFIKDFRVLHLNTRMQIGDWELWVKLAARGEFFYINKPVCDYRQHSSMSLRLDSSLVQFRQRDASFKRNLELASKSGVDVADLGLAYLEHAIVAGKCRAYREAITNMLKAILGLAFSMRGIGALVLRIFRL